MRECGGGGARNQRTRQVTPTERRLGYAAHHRIRAANIAHTTPHLRRGSDWYYAIRDFVLWLAVIVFIWTALDLLA